MEGTDDQESVKESEESDITDIEDEKIPKNITRNLFLELIDACRNSSERAKKRRKQIRNFKKGYSDTLEAIEGQQYGAGAF